MIALVAGLAVMAIEAAAVLAYLWIADRIGR